MPRSLIKSQPAANVSVALMGKLTKIWGFPFNIAAMAEANDFKFGVQLMFARAHHKITSRRKVGLGWARELPKI